MKFTHVGECRPEVMDELTQEYQPLAYAENVLKSFDHLLGVIKAQHPKRLVEYTANLETRYQHLVNSKYLSLAESDVAPLVAELVHIREYPSLARLFLNYRFQRLQLAKETKWKSEKVEVILRTWMRARYLPVYINLRILTETIPREKAIQLFKDFINDFMQKRVAEMDNRFETLEELRAMLLDVEKWGIVTNVGEVKEGKLIVRRDSCLHHALLADIPDEELKFLVCCFGDYEGVRSFNKCFKLTMEHTIVKGSPYCDCTYHDTRITKDLKHPSKEFFDSIWPLAGKE